MEIRTGRREMMGTLAGTLVALPAGPFLVSCSENEMPNGDNPAAAPTKNGTQIVYTSNTVDEHSHTFGLETSAIAMPTAAVSGATSSDSGHTHAVTISTEQLQSVGSGESVKVTTTSASGHTHVFTFVNVS